MLSNINGFIAKRLAIFSVFCFLLSPSLYAELKPGDQIGDDDKTGIDLVLKNYDFKSMTKELVFHLDQWNFDCKPKDAKDGLIGMRSHIIEPVYLADAGKYSNEAPSIGITIGSPRPDETGSLIEEGGAYVNIFRFPLFGIVMLGTSTGKMMEYEKGVPTIAYLAQLILKNGMMY